jgi:hypothetical protein
MLLIAFLATIGIVALIGGCVVAYKHKDILFPKH